jgi:putative endonuclease
LEDFLQAWGLDKALACIKDGEEGMREEKLFYVYMVADRGRVLYVGFTSDLEVRVKQHREGRFEGFTWRYGRDRLVWFERYGSAIDGISREKQFRDERRRLR